MCAPSPPELERLLAREERYSTLVEHSPYCIHEIDADGRLVSMNPAGLRMMGLDSESDIVGSYYMEAVCIEDHDRIRKLLEQSLQHGTASEFEFTASNGRVLQSNFVPLPIKKGKRARIMGITQDVTERRDLEQQLHRDRHLDSIGRLSGGVAHDFNNLLTVVMQAVESLRPHVEDGGLDDLEEIRTVADRAAQLTSQLLAIARKQVVEPRVFDVCEQLHALTGLSRRLVTEDIELLTSFGNDRLTVRMDASQFDRLMLNLVANAGDVMPDGGVLALEATRIEVHEPSADRPPGSYVRIAVTDSGPGIPDDIAERIFEPFYTTKDSVETTGTGLGLAMCRGIVQQADGTIGIASSGYRGTTFEVHLPFVDAEPDEISPAPVDYDEPGEAAILVVEDNDLVRSTIVTTLQSKGYTVNHASSGEEALAFAQTHEAPIELLITDVVLPGMNGQALAEQICRDRPELKVLFSSGYTDDVVLARIDEADRVNFLAKPYTPSQLLSKIGEVLR